MTDQVTTIVRHTLQIMKQSGLLSPRMTQYCLPPHTPRTAVIYFLKKIHKCPMGIRPIVSTVNSATANLAEFLDHYLQPIMKQLPAYLKDTTQFLREIADIPVHGETWLVTVDVKSLYTNIPNEEGIRACYEAWLKQETDNPQHPPAETLRQLLELVLKLNVFEFNDKHYLQIFGTAMGSKLAPAYANTFMGKLEKNILATSPLKPSYYHRFIDDIFMVWPHSEEELDQFITHMNRANQSIRFTSEKSTKEIVFLDVTVYKGRKNKTDNDSSGEVDTLCTLQTKTYIKPTNKQLYVRKGSYHPKGTGKGITVGEAIRYLRTNSDPNNFSSMLMQHKRNLIKRGYSGGEINRHLRNIKFSMRASKALKSKHETDDTDTRKKNTHTTTTKVGRPTFVTRFCPNAFRIVHKHWSTVDTDIPVLKRFLKTTPRMAYKSNKSLTKRLVRAKLKNTGETSTGDSTSSSSSSNNNNNSDTHTITTLAKLKHQLPKAKKRGKMTPCPDKKCPLHDKLTHSSVVRSRTTGRTYNTHGKANCNTPHVVYLIHCRKCKIQYVGQTAQSLRMRIARHLTAIRNTRVPGTLHEHFRPDRPCRGTNNVAFQMLQMVTPSTGDDNNGTTEGKLKKLETLWIKRLKCEYPQGLNWIEYDPRQRHKP